MKVIIKKIEKYARIVNFQFIRTSKLQLSVEIMFGSGIMSQNRIVVVKLLVSC